MLVVCIGGLWKAAEWGVLGVVHVEVHADMVRYAEAVECIAVLGLYDTLKCKLCCEIYCC